MFYFKKDGHINQDISVWQLAQNNTAFPFTLFELKEFRFKTRVNTSQASVRLAFRSAASYAKGLSLMIKQSNDKIGVAWMNGTQTVDVGEFSGLGSENTWCINKDNLVLNGGPIGVGWSKWSYAQSVTTNITITHSKSAQILIDVNPSKIF